MKAGYSALVHTHRVIPLLGLTLLLALPACSDDDGGGPEVKWTVEHSPGAFGVALVGGQLWLGRSPAADATATDPAELLQLDISDGSIGLTVPVDEPAVIGVVDGTVWVASGLEPEPLALTTGALGRGGLSTEGEIASRWSLASAGGRLFGRNDRLLYELDPVNGAIIAALELPLDTTGSTPEVLESAPLAGAGDLLLVDTTDRGDEAIAAVDVNTWTYRWVRRVDRFPVGLVVVADRAWVVQQDPVLRQRVLGIDLTTGDVVVEGHLPDDAAMLDDGNELLVAAADGTLWVLVGADNTVYRIDTDTGMAVEQFRFSIRPTTLAVSDDAVVVVSHIDDAVAKVARTEFQPVTTVS